MNKAEALELIEIMRSLPRETWALMCYIRQMSDEDVMNLAGMIRDSKDWIPTTDSSTEECFDDSDCGIKTHEETAEAEYETPEPEDSVDDSISIEDFRKFL